MRSLKFECFVKIRNAFMIYQARPLLKQALEDGNFDAVVDPKLEDFDSIEMVRMISCAAASVRHLARFRPRMGQVISQVLRILVSPFIRCLHSFDSVLIQS